MRRFVIIVSVLVVPAVMLIALLAGGGSGGDARDARAVAATAPGIGSNAAVFTEFDAATGSGALLTVGDNGRPSTIWSDPKFFFGDVAWSSDGTALAVAAGPNGTATDLYVVDVATGARHLVASAGDTAIRNPVWSPSSDEIVFSRHSSDGTARTAVVRRDGTVERPLADATTVGLSATTGDCSPMVSPAVVPYDWSPDGQRLLLGKFATCGDETSADVIVIDATGLNAKRLIDTGTMELDASWSPDGSRVVLEAPEGNISTVSPDGTTQQIVGAGFSPQWKPDGELTFVRPSRFDDATSYDVWTSPAADHAASRRVADAQVRADDPHFTHNGATAWFLGRASSGTELYTAPAAGGLPRAMSTPGGATVIDFDLREDS